MCLAVHVYGLPTWRGVGAAMGDVDFENNKIIVNKEVTWVNAKPVVQTPKTANGVRVVPLLTPLRAVLEPLKGCKNDFILGGGKPLKKLRIP